MRLKAFREEKPVSKLLLFLFLFVSFAVSFALNSNSVADQTFSAFQNPTPTPDSLFKIELNRKEIIIPCEPGYLPMKGTVCDDAKSITVRTIVSSPRNDKLSYKYKISGGQIIGKGEAVIWDLSNARPGTYTITAVVDDGGKTNEITETIIVNNCCPTCVNCACPEISVSSSKTFVKAGETISFTTNVSGGTSGELDFIWRISEGEIIDGQGTPTINVKTTPEMAGKKVKATVEIGGDGLCFDCLREFSETVSIKE